MTVIDIQTRKIQLVSVDVVSANGGRGGDDEMWQQTVETRLSELRADVQGIRTDLTGEFRAVRDRQERDFRLLFGVVVTVALGLAGLLAHGFKWIG